jgi:two-component system NtrC family response regulator
VKSLKRDGIIGNSGVILDCLDRVAHCATQNLNVLISGETGTGKELFARTIHDNSKRSNKPFIVVDCAALPENIVESILFGHEKGAFTGADSARPGLVKAADGGTLFLDEIGELPLSVQKAFLRVLQERRFRPVGSTQEVSSDFRLISATNRNLKTMVKAGTFREDLLYRLKTTHIELPALRDRKEDIPDLVNFFVRDACHQTDRKNVAVVFDVVDILKSYDWPGNVRELKSTIEQAVVSQGQSDVLYPIALPDRLRVKHIRSKWTGDKSGGHFVADTVQTPIRLHWTPPQSSEEIRPFKEVRNTITEQIEKDYLSHLVNLLGGNFKRISEYSGLGRSRLYNLFSKHEISLN